MQTYLQYVTNCRLNGGMLIMYIKLGNLSRARRLLTLFRLAEAIGGD
jgi:hypothetical protein